MPTAHHNCCCQSDIILPNPIPVPDPENPPLGDRSFRQMWARLAHPLHDYLTFYGISYHWGPTYLQLWLPRNIQFRAAPKPLIGESQFSYPLEQTRMVSAELVFNETGFVGRNYQGFVDNDWLKLPMMIHGQERPWTKASKEWEQMPVLQSMMLESPATWCHEHSRYGYYSPSNFQQHDCNYFGFTDMMFSFGSFTYLEMEEIAANDPQKAQGMKDEWVDLYISEMRLRGYDSEYDWPLGRSTTQDIWKSALGFFNHRPIGHPSRLTKVALGIGLGAPFACTYSPGAEGLIAPNRLGYGMHGTLDTYQSYPKTFGVLFHTPPGSSLPDWWGMGEGINAIGMPWLEGLSDDTYRPLFPLWDEKSGEGPDGSQWPSCGFYHDYFSYESPIHWNQDFDGISALDAPGGVDWRELPYGKGSPVMATLLDEIGNAVPKVRQAEGFPGFNMGFGNDHLVHSLVEFSPRPSQISDQCPPEVADYIFENCPDIGPFYVVTDGP